MIVNMLINFAKTKRSFLSKVIFIFIGFLLSLAVIPFCLILIGNYFFGHFTELPFFIDVPISIISTLAGLSLVMWTVITQWEIGDGTPAPFAPTQRLIIVGPYKLCRNPIQLGAILYYLGVGTIFGGFWVGLFCFTFGLVLGTVYHKYVEEKELEIRFGQEYINYKKTTPFIIPRF